MANWTLTHHAQLRIQQIHITPAEVDVALEAPEISYPCGPDYPGRSVVLGGRLAIVVDDSSPIVVTVLWRGATGRAA
jgi:hypothetical protein